MTPGDARRAAAVPGVPVADRLRALADAPWVARATSTTLREGADEVERLTRELADAHALARGAQYREREALGEAAVLRARLDGALDECDEAVNVLRLRERAVARWREIAGDAVDHARRLDALSLSGAIADERERCAELCADAAARWKTRAPGEAVSSDSRRERGNEAAALAAEIRAALPAKGDAGDLAALARREAGPVTRRQWRACARCGQCFWLADDEAVPGHGVRDAWGADRACGAVVTSEGSEGR